MILFTTLLEKEIIMKGLFLEEIDKSGLLIIFIALLTVLFTLTLSQAQELKTIKLPEVNKHRGSSLMDALSKKASAQNWSDKDVSMQDLSDLLWAAAGINRPDSKKRTYSSAMNTQDVDVYVFMKDGVYIYDYENHALKPVISGDHRADIAGSFSMSGGGMPSGGASGGAPGAAPAGAGQPGGAPGGAAPAGVPSTGAGSGTRSASFPVDLLLVSDPSKYRAGTDDLKKEWGAFSAGIITQNVMLFCSANELGTRPRAMFDKAKLKTLLKLKDTQNPVIELPVGYLR
jgi:nitroreductase